MCEECKASSGHLPGCPNAPIEKHDCKCCRCGEWMYSDEQPSYEGEFYCDQHWKEFLDTASAEFVEDYIALHEKEYYERWYTSVLLTDRERLEALKLFYQLKRSEYVDELTLDRMEFFKESSDFLEFMKGKLKIR